MKSDEQVQRDVESELRWQSGIDSTDVSVRVREGVVMLAGYARNYGERSEAEAVAGRIVGVMAVANDIQVRIEQAFRSRADLDASQVSMETDGSDVKLTGKVTSVSERTAALAVACATPGVSTVMDELIVRE